MQFFFYWLDFQIQAHTDSYGHAHIHHYHIVMHSSTQGLNSELLMWSKTGWKVNNYLFSTLKFLWENFISDLFSSVEGVKKYVNLLFSSKFYLDQRRTDPKREKLWTIHEKLSSSIPRLSNGCENLNSSLAIWPICQSWYH